MKRYTSILLMIGLAASLQAQQFQVSSQSSLSFDGTSTLHDFTCTAKKITGTITAVDRNIQAARIEIPVRSIESGKEDMNKNMYEAFKADAYPSIVFELSALTSVAGALRAKGQLTIAGVTKNIEMPVSVSWPADQLEVAGDYTLNMSDYGIKPPKMFLGTIKTGDAVTVHFKIAGSGRANN